MDAPYRYETLPLDTPDDDPRWGDYLDIFNNGFLDGRSSDESIATFRESRRADRADLGMVTTDGPGLDGRQPVAAFASAPFTMNAGAGIVDCQVINTIAVRASHRRRGLLAAMMAEQLGSVRERGLGCAVLSASEGTIYGRFGFGVTNRLATHEIDTRRFRLAEHARVAPGTVEFVHPSFLTDHFERINLAHQKRHRGAFGRQRGHQLWVTGAWDRGDNGPSKSLRAVVHFDEQQVPDGYAVFRHKGWDSQPITAEVTEVCAPDPSVELALWQMLASMDLVERLTCELVFDHPLPLALVDPWAVKTTEVGDWEWLRIVNLEKAVAERGFQFDGVLIMEISDPYEWCSGTWQLTVTDGRGTVQRTDAAPEVSLGIAALGRMWFGDRSLVDLAGAGLAAGEDEAVRRGARLFAVDTPPVNLSHF